MENKDQQNILLMAIAGIGLYLFFKKKSTIAPVVPPTTGGGSELQPIAPSPVYTAPVQPIYAPTEPVYIEPTQPIAPSPINIPEPTPVYEPEPVIAPEPIGSGSGGLFDFINNQLWLGNLNLSQAESFMAVDTTTKDQSDQA